MPSGGRALDQAHRRATRMRYALGEEIRRARLSAGLSQNAIAQATHVSQPVLSRIEAGTLTTVPIETLVIVAHAVGLEVACRAYPGRGPTRDAAHARKLQGLMSHVSPPLRFKLEVPLPQREGFVERRAWDATLFAADGTTGIELEMRLYDIQDQMRRVMLKWRDSGADRLLLVLSDTKAMREIVRAYPDYLVELPRLKTAGVLAQLERGERPPTGYLLI